MTLTELFTNIANAIREQKGTSDKIKATDFATEIASLSPKSVTLSKTIDFGYGYHTVVLDYSSYFSRLIGISSVKITNPQDPRSRSISITIDEDKRTITCVWYKTNSDTERNNTFSITAIGY